MMGQSVYITEIRPTASTYGNGWGWPNEVVVVYRRVYQNDSVDTRGQVALQRSIEAFKKSLARDEALGPMRFRRCAMAPTTLVARRPDHAGDRPTTRAPVLLVRSRGRAPRAPR